MRKGPQKLKLNFKLKAPKFPDDMIVIQDTREQLPLFNRPPKGLTIRIDGLKDGDYSILGHEKTFCIERKMISDLVGYCTAEYESKTRAKMERFKKMEWVGLVIEARESEVYRPYLWSGASPEAVRQALVSFTIRYGVHVYITDDREKIARWIFDRMIKFYSVAREL